jgi:3-hydroxybutyryl-CoA dehydrogenase
MQQVTFQVVGIIGAGAMGRGIAQIAAQAGSVVKLFDTRSEAVVEAVQAISTQWSRLQEKGRMTVEVLAENKSRLIGANAPV